VATRAWQPSLLGCGAHAVAATFYRHGPDALRLFVGKRTCNYFLRTLELKASRLVGLGANKEEIMGLRKKLWVEVFCFG
jgi:hypothetical protein